MTTKALSDFKKFRHIIYCLKLAELGPFATTGPLILTDIIPSSFVNVSSLVHIVLEMILKQTDYYTLH